MVRCRRRAGVIAPAAAEFSEETDDVGDTPLPALRNFLKAPSPPERR